MTTYNAGLLTPPGLEEEQLPYRPVWRSIVIEYGILSAVVIGLFVAVNYIGITIPASVQVPLNAALVLLPVGLWLVFSLLPERGVPEPRTSLQSIVIISALVAAAVGYPLIADWLQVEQWLSLAPAVQRIFGYTFTVGIIQETLKYLVLRYLIWDRNLTNRQDAIAAAAAAALGYATVLNLHFGLTGTPPPDVVMVHVYSVMTLHLVSTVVVAYGLAETKLINASPLVLPVALGLASFIHGVAIPVRAGLVNASISPLFLEFSLPRPLYGIVFSAALLIAGALLVYFFFVTSERREREIRASREE